MEKAEFYVGTYSKADEESIYLFEADFEKGIFTKIHSHTGTPNPSYLLENSKGLIYAVEELETGGDVSVFTVSENGFEKKTKLSSYGKNPCHLELNSEEDLLFVANYSSGSLATFKLDHDGMPVDLWNLKEHEGKGLNPERQEAPHVHFSKYLEGLIYTCDLGLDKVFCYEVNKEQKEIISAAGDLILPAGCGPRHLCIHPENDKLMYVAAELTAEVFVFKQNGMCYELFQSVNSLPDGVPSENRVAAVKCSEDGRYLFVSNRGNDTLTAFLIDNDGLLTVTDVCSSGGKAPRDFTPFGDYLVISNQDSSLLTVLHFDRDKEKFKKLSMKETVGHPVCITAKRVNQGA